MSVSSLIPEIWSSSIARGFEKASVYASCLARVYEGEARVGNTVKIPRIGAVSVKPYAMRTPITYDDIEATTQDIVIDQASYWALRTEDIEKTQANTDFLNAATANAAYALRDTVDQYVAGILNTGAGITADLGTIDAPMLIASGDVVGLFALLGQKFTEHNIPMMGRWVVIPAWLHKKLVLAKVEREVSNTAILSEGYVGRFLGFDVLVSNNVPVAGGKYSLLAGVADCGTLITQITETEGMRDAQQFGDLVRGLLVYTSKVLQTNALAKAVITENADEPAGD